MFFFNIKLMHVYISLYTFTKLTVLPILLSNLSNYCVNLKTIFSIICRYINLYFFDITGSLEIVLEKYKQNLCRFLQIYKNSIRVEYIKTLSNTQ